MKTINIDKIEMAECEDCHKPIQPSENNRWGFVSQESSSMKATSIMGLAAIEVLERVVCRKCYLAGFARVYPKDKLPKLTGGEIYAKE